MERKGLRVNTAKTEVMVSSKERENINVVDRHNNQLKQTEAFKYLGSTSLQQNVWNWQRCMERKGLRVNTAKTEVMVSSKERENINVVDRHNNQLKQTEAFKYLGSTLTETGSCEREVAARVNAAWNKWRKLIPVICDKQMSLRARAKVYKSIVRPVLLYGAETRATKETDLKLLEKTEMRMLMWIKGISLKDHVKSEKIRAELGVAQIRDKVKEARLRCFGRVKRSDSYIKTAYEMKVIEKRSSGRQKIRWSDCLSKDVKERKLKEEDAIDRERWRKKIKMPEPPISCS